MGRRAKTPKGKAAPNRARASTPPKNEGCGVRDLERRLEEAQEQQTATAEILRVISQSPTDIQSVFETLLQRAVRLCAAGCAALFRFDGSQI